MKILGNILFVRIFLFYYNYKRKYFPIIKYYANKGNYIKDMIDNLEQ